ncbi:double-strand break repair protein AddB [Chthonobacter rhizosphaerae]|uniref:double-strand break repair protein AddB n=1 Tax=Chthonobacter rhizosphaerae TaxID=2735553 RepID=UPI0015EEFD2C|nr:double-strand break repair protein AddB [Chthonobacter rhizosphaerae]
MARPVPRVFTIPPGAPFLPTLVDALLDGVLIEGRRFRDDPLALADVTLYLPTRRAARALSGTLLAAFGGRAALLPRILPLGDVDDDLVERLADPSDLDLPPDLPEADRVLGLARLIRDWRRFVTPDRHLSPAGEPLRVPHSTADAVHLARDLLALLDQATAESVDWSRLSGLVPDDYAAWWQLTLTFLTIATDAWPAHLAERGRIDPVARRVRVTHAIAERLERDGARGPVIVAGSTGSMPATARLIAAIARQPEGAVVLPGLDLGLDEATFAGMPPDLAGVADVASHPQGAMARLLAAIGIGREEVASLGREPENAARRFRLVSEAMRPADSTDRWPAFAASLAPDGLETALDGMALVVAANEAEEALAVALALRETLETEGATAALVTPDRTLARRVCTELARFGVTVEDSAGTPLERTPTGVLLELVAEAALDGMKPQTVVSLLSHPLATFGFDKARAKAAARALQLAVLRGPRLAPGTAALLAAAERLAVPGRTGHGVHPAVTALGPDRLADARRLAARLHEALRPLEDAAARGADDLRVWLDLHVAAVRAVCTDAGGVDDHAFDGPAGGVAAELLTGYLDSTAEPLEVPPDQYPAVFRALMRGAVVRRPTHGHARVFIWGPLEARLMTVDRLVVGGLNEGVWPLSTDTGPWLSRPMRAGLDFAPPEQRIGLSAHDFVQALGHRDVVLTRSERRDGAPTVATRFLQRVLALAGEDRTRTMMEHGACYLDWARRIDDGDSEPRAERPEPKPPLAARPKRLSVTEIETWIRDPYAIYARRILKLEPLPALGERPDFGTRGQAVHEALSLFADSWSGPFDETAVEALIAAGRETFRQLEAYPEVHALWWPRFMAAARYVVREFEAARPGVERVSEVSGRLEVVPGDDGFVLTGRADRIDLLPNGRVSIVDFKTGTAPSARQIAALKAPQLPLEAAMVRAGGFPTVKAAEADELVHVVLRGIEGKDEIRPFAGYSGKDFARTLPEVVVEAELALTRLVHAYRDPDRGYRSKAHPFRVTDRSDYDHLARVREWSVAEDGEGEA